MSIRDISEIREFINRIPPLYLGQLKISCANDKKEALKNLIIEKAHLFGSGAINTLDGLRMDFERSWILVRPSGTEPVFRIIAESPTAAETERLLENASSTLRKLAGL
jgi:phosphomannomutase